MKCISMIRLASWSLLASSAVALRQSADDGEKGLGDIVAKVSNWVMGSMDLTQYGVHVHPLTCADPDVGWSTHVSLSCGSKDVVVDNPPPAKGYQKFKDPYLMKLGNFNINLTCSLGAATKLYMTGRSDESICNITLLNFLPFPPHFHIETANADNFLNNALGGVLPLHDLGFDNSNIDLFMKRFQKAENAAELEAETKTSGAPVLNIDHMQIHMGAANLTVNGGEILWTGGDTQKMLEILKSKSAEDFDLGKVLSTICDVVAAILFRHFGKFVQGYVDAFNDIAKGVGDFVGNLNPFDQRHQKPAGR